MPSSPTRHAIRVRELALFDRIRARGAEAAEARRNNVQLPIPISLGGSFTPINAVALQGAVWPPPNVWPPPLPAPSVRRSRNQAPPRMIFLSPTPSIDNAPAASDKVTSPQDPRPDPAREDILLESLPSTSVLLASSTPMSDSAGPPETPTPPTSSDTDSSFPSISALLHRPRGFARRVPSGSPTPAPSSSSQSSFHTAPLTPAANSSNLELPDQEFFVAEVLARRQGGVQDFADPNMTKKSCAEEDVHQFYYKVDWTATDLSPEYLHREAGRTYAICNGTKWYVEKTFPIVRREKGERGEEGARLELLLAQWCPTWRAKDALPKAKRLIHAFDRSHRERFDLNPQRVVAQSIESDSDSDSSDPFAISDVESRDLFTDGESDSASDAIALARFGGDLTDKIMHAARRRPQKRAPSTLNRIVNDPDQRRFVGFNKKLNMARSEMITAAVVYIKGTENESPCAKCRRTNSAMACVSMPRFNKGACTCCVFSGRGSRCTHNADRAANKGPPTPPVSSPVTQPAQLASIAEPFTLHADSSRITGASPPTISSSSSSSSRAAAKRRLPLAESDTPYRAPTGSQTISKRRKLRSSDSGPAKPSSTMSHPECDAFCQRQRARTKDMRQDVILRDHAGFAAEEASVYQVRWLLFHCDCYTVELLEYKWWKHYEHLARQSQTKLVVWRKEHYWAKHQFRILNEVIPFCPEPGESAVHSIQLY